ncbi:MAG TPA: crotonase/enoyl-CoA hydratase family protein [Trebonia sp.]|jgi:enoyl-CoA hydratase|nr:crotonase/enoyl-CoA hydratase family protein [Trebonia sp.]
MPPTDASTPDGAPSSQEPVLTSQHGSTLLVTLNRPRARNAIDRATAEAIGRAMDELDSRPDLAVGVITGAAPAFCAGMDLKAFLRGERPTTDRGFAGLTARPPAKPLIAAVEGPALAGGFEIVLACDLVVAAETASFGVPEVTRGLVAAAGGVLRLQERIPFNLAMEWVLTGAMVDAATAQRVGLVNRLVPPGAAVETALELAAVIAANAPLAVRASKRILRESRDWPQPEAFDRQAPIVAVAQGSADAREGALAFTEKRAPVWRGE